MEEHYIEITHTCENSECDECEALQSHSGQEEGDASPVRYGIPGQAGDDGRESSMTEDDFDIPERKWFVIPSNSRGLIIFVKN